MCRETANEPNRGERTSAFGERRFGDVWTGRPWAGVLSIGHESIISDCAETDWTEADLYRALSINYRALQYQHSWECGSR
jgi:hypothetical protein